MFSEKLSFLHKNSDKRPVTFNRVKLFSNLVLLVFLCSCTSKNTVDVKSKELRINDFLTITIKGKILEDDLLEVYFAENIQENYTVKNRCRIRVKGSKNTQEIRFKLPKRTYPFKLRIDLGNEGHETPVEIEEIKLSTGSKSKIFRNEELRKAFRPNQYLELHPNSKTFIRRKLGESYDPFLLSNDFTEIIVDLFSE